MALINAPFRMVDKKIVVTHKDIDEAMKLWSAVCSSMAYSLSPQLFNIYKNVILPVWYKKNEKNGQPKGITLKEFRAEYYKKMGSYPSIDSVQKRWLPTLEASEFISCYRDKDGDMREKMIMPLVFFDDDSMEEKA